MAIRDELRSISAEVGATNNKIDKLAEALNAHLIQSAAGTQRVAEACRKLDRHLDDHEKEMDVLREARETKRELAGHLGDHKAMRKWWLGVLGTLVGAAALGLWNWVRINILMNGKPPIHP
jgi:hypothetical protein